jgi:hypothetical protein
MRNSRTIIGLLLFGISFGYVEAAVVVYLRTLYEPLRARLLSAPPSREVFPLVDLAALQAAAPEAARLLPIEIAREAATLIMLAGAALLAVRARNQWLPAFAVAFGIWDLSFYVFLKLWLGWPASLMTWDLLFLIPVPWASPVLAPVLVSVLMILCGLAALTRPTELRRLHWAGLLTGAALILVAFMEDFRSLMAGNPPGQFGWTLFLGGAAMGLAAFLHAFRVSRGNALPVHHV